MIASLGYGVIFLTAVVVLVCCFCMFLIYLGSNDRPGGGG